MWDLTTILTRVQKHSYTLRLIAELLSTGMTLHPKRDYATQQCTIGELCLPRERLCSRLHVQWGTMPAQGGTMPSSSCTLHKYTETLCLWVVYRDTESQSGTLTTVALWPPNTWTYDLSHDVPSTNALAPLLSENALYENIQTEMWDTNMKELDILDWILYLYS